MQEKGGDSVLLVLKDELNGKLDPIDVAEINNNKVDVHLNSIVGISNPKTMKMEGVIREQKVMVLSDNTYLHSRRSTVTGIIAIKWVLEIYLRKTEGVAYTKRSEIREESYHFNFIRTGIASYEVHHERGSQLR